MNRPGKTAWPDAAVPADREASSAPAWARPPSIAPSTAAPMASAWAHSAQPAPIPDSAPIPTAALVAAAEAVEEEEEEAAEEAEEEVAAAAAVEAEAVVVEAPAGAE